MKVVLLHDNVGAVESHSILIKVGNVTGAKDVVGTAIMKNSISTVAIAEILFESVLIAFVAHLQSYPSVVAEIIATHAIVVAENHVHALAVPGARIFRHGIEMGVVEKYPVCLCAGYHVLF